MADQHRAARAVDRLATADQGRVIVVSPLGPRGNPHDPDHLDAVTADDHGLYLSIGHGHAMYDLSGVQGVSAKAQSVLVRARRLDMVFTAYGSGAVQKWEFDDAELLITSGTEMLRRTAGIRRVKGVP